MMSRAYTVRATFRVGTVACVGGSEPAAVGATV